MKRMGIFSAGWLLLFTAGMAVAAPAGKTQGKRPVKATVKQEVISEQETTGAVPRASAPQSPVAMNNMANMYYQGKGVKQDYAKALYLYKKAAEQGHVASIITVGYMYEYGQGVTRDYGLAMQWYQKAAAKGYASAQRAMGDLYRLGHGVKKDDAAAAQWYQKASDQGDAEAQCQLGYMMIRGRGVPQDMLQAKAVLEAGAAQNNACSQHYLAFMYMHGLIGTLPDTKKALVLDRMAAANGNAEAQYNIGKANEIGWVEYASEAEALSWYRHSANKGYPLAMVRLAEVYEKGGLKEKTDAGEAQLWREKAESAWADWPELRPDMTEKIRFMPQK